MPIPPLRRTIRRLWILTACGTALWLGAIVLAPWLAGRGAGGPARFVYALFAPFCHQIPGRCFVLGDHPLAVCGRCLGIYAGFAAGLGLYPLVRGFERLSLPSVRMLVLFTLPLSVDAAAGLTGLWSSSIGLRFATGFVWGTLLPYYFVTGAADLVRSRQERAAERALENRPGTQ